MSSALFMFHCVDSIWVRNFQASSSDTLVYKHFESFFIQDTRDVVDCVSSVIQMFIHLLLSVEICPDKTNDS